MRKLIVLSGLVIVCLWAATSTAQAKIEVRYQDYVTKGLLCIHTYEGSWTDPNAPYWGGLQMDYSFQQTYGYRWVGKHKWWGHKIYFMKDSKWGTADKWPVWAQLVAGRHGYYSRGWSPWPNTARYCGLM